MKVFLPPFIGFVIFGVIVLFDSFIYPMHVGDMGGGNIHAFMACFYYCWPLYFLTALLTQGVIVIPVWEAAFAWSAMSRDIAVIVMCAVCALFAAGIAYCIWDKQTGFFHFIALGAIMLLVQLAYWIINFFVMILFVDKIKAKHAAKKIAG